MQRDMNTALYYLTIVLLLCHFCTIVCAETLAVWNTKSDERYSYHYNQILLLMRSLYITQSPLRWKHYLQLLNSFSNIISATIAACSQLRHFNRKQTNRQQKKTSHTNANLCHIVILSHSNKYFTSDTGRSSMLNTHFSITQSLKDWQAKLQSKFCAHSRLIWSPFLSCWF